MVFLESNTGISSIDDEEEDKNEFEKGNDEDLEEEVDDRITSSQPSDILSSLLHQSHFTNSLLHPLPDKEVSSLLQTTLPPPSTTDILSSGNHHHPLSSLGTSNSFSYSNSFLNVHSPEMEPIFSAIFKRYCNPEHQETRFASSILELLKKIAADELVIAEKVKLGYLHSSYEQLYSQNEYLRIEAEYYRQLSSAYYPNSTAQSNTTFSSVGYSHPTDPLSNNISTLPMPLGVSYPPVILPGPGGKKFKKKNI